MVWKFDRDPNKAFAITDQEYHPLLKYQYCVDELNLQPFKTAIFQWTPQYQQLHCKQWVEQKEF